MDSKNCRRRVLGGNAVRNVQIGVVDAIARAHIGDFRHLGGTSSGLDPRGQEATQ